MYSTLSCDDYELAGPARSLGNAEGADPPAELALVGEPEGAALVEGSCHAVSEQQLIRPLGVGGDEVVDTFGAELFLGHPSQVPEPLELWHLLRDGLAGVPGWRTLHLRLCLKLWWKVLLLLLLLQ